MLQIIGITDEITECGRCGKYNLKKIIVIEDTETGSINYYGSECASMLLHFDKKTIATLAKKAKKEQEEKVRSCQGLRRKSYRL